VPLVGAVLADFFRCLLVCVIFVGFGYVMGFRIGTDPLWLLAAIRLSIAFVLLLAVGLDRHEGAHTRGGAGHHVHAHPAAVVRQQRVRADRQHARGCRRS
jgi:hypothetical protein